MTENQQKKNIDFNELFNADNLKDIPIGKCIPSPDGKILACRVNETEWDIETDTTKLKGKVKINL